MLSICLVSSRTSNVYVVTFRGICRYTSFPRPVLFNLFFVRADLEIFDMAAAHYKQQLLNHHKLSNAATLLKTLCNSQDHKTLKSTGIA